VPELNDWLGGFDLCHALLIGAPGTGKTTELYALMAAQAPLRRVVYLDVQANLAERGGDPSALDRLEPWELLVVLGLALVESSRQLGFRLGPEVARFDTAARALLPEVAAGGFSASSLARGLLLTVGGASAALAAAGAISPENAAVVSATTGAMATLSETLGGATRFGRRPEPTPSLADSDSRVRELLDSVSSLAHSIEQGGEPIVLLVDGLDRAADATVATDLFHRLFVYSSLLARIECHIVAVAPFAAGTQTTLAHGFALCRTIPNIHVATHGAPRRPDPEGLQFFRELHARRTAGDAGLQGLISPAQLDMLAYYSGGRVRELARLIQGVCVAAQGAPAAADSAVEQALDNHRLNMVEQGQADSGVLAALRHAASTGELDERRPEINRQLIATFRLLAYRNGAEWWSPHPLFFRGLLKE
jgi:hypothetical protein